MEHGHEIVDGNAALVHGVPVADGYLLVIQGVEIHGDAVGCADLVLAAVAAADALSIVELCSEVTPQPCMDILDSGNEFVVAA